MLMWWEVICIFFLNCHTKVRVSCRIFPWRGKKFCVQSVQKMVTFYIPQICIFLLKFQWFASKYLWVNFCGFFVSSMLYNQSYLILMSIWEGGGGNPSPPPFCMKPWFKFKFLLYSVYHYSQVPRPSHVSPHFTWKIGKAWSIMWCTCNDDTFWDKNFHSFVHTSIYMYYSTS